MSEVSVFMRQMATLISAGVPMIQCFNIIYSTSKKTAFSKCILKLKIYIENGYTLSESFTLYPRYFDSLCCGLISAGEISGRLEEMFERIATHQEKSASLIRQIKKAFFYPIIVTIIALSVFILLLFYVVPQFEVLFYNFGAELPAFTQWVIGLSNRLREQGWIIASSGGLLVLGIRRILQQSISAQSKLDAWLLQIPIIGKILEKTIIARFTHTLGILFGAGIPLVEALGAATKVAHNAVYMKALLKVKHRVAQGTTLKTALEDVQLFPNMVIQMIHVGEQSGSLESLLAKISTLYEEDIDFSIEACSRLVEPLLMVVLGLFVGGLIIALYLPIFSMGKIA